MPEPVPILKETEDQIAALHPAGDRENVRAMLMEYGTQRWHKEVERVRFDILHLSAGSVERVRSLVDLAMRDPRDVMSREYFFEGGISKPHSWAMVHEINRKLQARIDAGEIKSRPRGKRGDSATPLRGVSEEAR